MGLSFYIREKCIVFYEKEVAVVSCGRVPHHLRWCHIRNKTERLSDRK